MLQAKFKKKLGSFQLDVDLQTDGGILALLGASGCGKSVTLQCIAGILRPDEGRIVVNDRILYDSEQKIDLPPQKRKVGYLFQQYALFPHMSVAQNIGAALPGKTGSEKQQAIAEQIKAFRLEGLEERKPHQLSGGQQQRTALARIFAGRPEVLLLDEPFTALDNYLKWQLELELSDILDRFDGDVLFVSHDRNEVIRMCERVCVLNSGSTGPIGTVKDLMRSPGTISAAMISGCKNFSDAAKVDDHTIRCTDWGVDLKTQDLVTDAVVAVGIRAHYLEPEFESKGADDIDLYHETDKTGANGVYSDHGDDKTGTNGIDPIHGVEKTEADEIDSDYDAGVTGTDDMEDFAMENRIPMRVARIIEDAFSTILMLETPGGKTGRSLIRYEAEKGSVPDLEIGDAIMVRVPPEAVMLLYPDRSRETL